MLFLVLIEMKNRGEAYTSVNTDLLENLPVLEPFKRTSISIQLERTFQSESPADIKSCRRRHGPMREPMVPVRKFG